MRDLSDNQEVEIRHAFILFYIMSPYSEIVPLLLVSHYSTDPLVAITRQDMMRCTNEDWKLQMLYNSAGTRWRATFLQKPTL